MKKKFISICITLILFCSSVVPVFAAELVTDTQVPFWLLDIRNQCYLSNNAADVTFGLATYGNDASHYLVEIVKGGALYLTYEVPAGETVYFRWAIARNNMGNTGASTFVRMSVDGSQKVNHTYNYSNLGDYGTYGSIVIVEDYTNTSNSKQLVTYVIENDGVGNPTYEYVPILVGTNALINQGSTSFGDFDFTVDLTSVEDKLDSIINILNKPQDLSFNIPTEMWQYYSYFINAYNYEYRVSSDRLPWLYRTEYFTTGYDSSKILRYLYNYDYIYLSLFFYEYNTGKPVLYGSDGSVINPVTHAYSIRGNGLGTIYTYKFTIPDKSVNYSLYLPDTTQYDKFIPLYFGNEFGVTELVSSYTGIPTKVDKRFAEVIGYLSNLVNLFNDNNSVSNSNANIVNDNLSNTVTEFDNIEKEQVTNFTENIANLPSFDFGSISDFSTTANFVSTQMQNIYNSSDYIKFIYTAVLTFGIALVLIGRGLRR